MWHYFDTVRFSAKVTWIVDDEHITETCYRFAFGRAITISYITWTTDMNSIVIQLTFLDKLYVFQSNVMLSK